MADAALVNRLLDALPRTRFGHAAREVPAFRTCGITGFYGAVAAIVAGGLLTGRSLLVLAALAVVCAISFFAYVYARRSLTGKETLVLLDQVWIAEASVAAALWALREPVLPYMDIVSVGIAVFLTGGRVGCLLVGCCHGRPSSLGIVYGAEHVSEGFAPHLMGVRLFPVQAVEAAGLALIAATGMAALPFAAPGRVWLWFLAGYGVLRFGTEALRGDARPHWLGLSKARWMALAEIALALWLAREGAASGRDALIFALLLVTLAVALIVRHGFEPRRRILSGGHVAEVRDAVSALVEQAASDASGAEGRMPPVRTSTRGVAVGISSADGAAGELHASLTLPSGGRDVALLCQLALLICPGLHADSAQLSPRGVLHFRLRGGPPVPPADVADEAAALYGTVVRRRQCAAETAAAPRRPEAADDVSERSRYFGAPAPVFLPSPQRGVDVAMEEAVSWHP